MDTLLDADTLFDALLAFVILAVIIFSGCYVDGIGGAGSSHTAAFGRSADKAGGGWRAPRVDQRAHRIHADTVCDNADTVCDGNHTRPGRW
jgi:hypothetical protein